MFISISGPNAYCVSELEKLPSRRQYRFRIFLASISEAVVEDRETSVVIRYMDSDPRHIKDLYSFLLDFDNDVSISNEVSTQLQQIEQAEEKRKETVTQVLAAKAGNIQDSEEYEAFRRFCNSKLVIELRDYQSKAAFLLCLGRGGFDFSVPGAGKTIIAYTAYAYMKNKAIVEKILIVGPISSYNAWIDEYYTCFGRTPDFISLASEDKGYCRDYLQASAKNHHEVTFINYDKLRLLKNEISVFLKASPTLLVIDEAHKIKSPSAKSTQAALSFSPYASVRILLTGTPMPNGYEDLFALMQVFSPVEPILPFRYAQLKMMTKKGASEVDLQRLKSSIAPYYSRISKQYLISKGELKPANISRVHTVMDSNQISLYNRLEAFCRKTQEDIDEDLLFAFKKAVLIRKMQISANPMLLQKPISASMDEFYLQLSDGELDEEKLAKADAKIMSIFSRSSIAKIVNQYCNGDVTTNKNIKAIQLAADLVTQRKKVLIWDVFIQNMEYLYSQMISLFPGQIEIINGSVSFEERQVALKRFREGTSMVLIANPATLAESISLHRACQNAIYVNRNFNCAQYIQSKDRIHRINMPFGTTANYTFILNRDCVDESVDDRLNVKERRMLEILDSEDIIIGGAEMEDANVMSQQDIELCFDRK